MSNLDYLCKTGSLCLSANSLCKIKKIHELGRGKYTQMSNLKLRLKFPKNSSLLTRAFKSLGSFENASLDFKTIKAETNLHHKLFLVLCKPRLTV